MVNDRNAGFKQKLASFTPRDRKVFVNQRIQIHESNQFTTHLHKAVIQSNNELVLILLENNADIQAFDSTGNTALHITCINGNSEILSTIISFYKSRNGKDGIKQLINTPNCFSLKTALHYASE